MKSRDITARQIRTESSIANKIGNEAHIKSTNIILNSICIFCHLACYTTTLSTFCNIIMLCLRNLSPFVLLFGDARMIKL